MLFSRRQFNRMSSALVASTMVGRSAYARANDNLNLGLNTWSLRALGQREAIPVIVQTMKQCALEHCQLLFSHVEPEDLSPVFPTGQFVMPRTPPTPDQVQAQQKQDAALTAWRLSVPMSYFEDIRSKFTKEGLSITAYAARLGSSEAEIDRQFLMTRALGAESMIARVPEATTSLVAAAAEKYGMIVGLQFSNENALRTQLAASKFFRIDPDIGDLTKAGIDSLRFVKADYASMSAVDLKDALVDGASVPFGEGSSQMREVLRFLKEKDVRVTAYVDCDYAGTGRSIDEVAKCVAYCRRCLA